MKYIFLHGLGQNASSWEETIAFLPKDLEAINVELNEFFTEKNCNYSNIYSKLSAYLNNFSEKIDICGLSLGAVLALNYAVDFPEKVNRLLLVAPQFKMPKMLLKAQNFVFKLMPESSFSATGIKKVNMNSLTNSMADIDFTNRLEKIACPVTVLCGDKDKANRKAAVMLAKMLKNGRFYVVKNSGHEVNIDQPKTLAKVIVSRK